MRILFLSPRQCWPALNGARLREYHLARALSRSAELTYAYFAEPGAAPLTADDLSFPARIIAVPKPSAYGPWKLVRGIAGKWPLPILNYTSVQMEAALARLDASPGYDLVHLESIHMIRYVKSLERILAKVPRVTYNWHNIESEAMRRYAESTPSQAKRIYANLTAGKLETLEREILAKAFGHIVCSERESIQLRRIAPAARIAVVENGVDCGYFREPKNGHKLHRIVYVGWMAYPPNVEATVAFAHKTWPMVREQLSGVILTIVGLNPTAAVRALASIPEIEVTGTVPDVRPYYREALAAVVPLRTGGGTRLKILEAMAAGVPVVSTPIGAEGLAVSPGSDILISDPDDHASWVRHLVELAHCEGLRKRITTRGLLLVNSRYDWTTLGQGLVETYEDWLRNG